MVATVTQSELKAACLALLDKAAVKHPAGHQGKLAARYVLRAGSDERIGLMFEKSEKTKAYLWIEKRFADGLVSRDIDHRCYPANELYKAAKDGEKPAYGRHAGLKAMRDLANADLVRFEIVRLEQLETILSSLASPSA